MNFLNRARLERMAAGDAKSQHDANLDHMVTAFLGPRPKGPGEVEDELLIEGEGHELRIEEIEDELEALERQRAETKPRVLYLMLAVAAFICESWAAFVVLESLGYEARERLIVGVSLAAGTALVAGGVSYVERSASSPFTRWSIRLLSAVIFMLVVASLAYLRATTGDDNLSILDLVSTALTLACATAAPALVFHIATTGFTKSSSLASRRRRALRERKRLTRSQDKSQGRQIKDERQSAEWDRDAAQARSLYLATHRRVTAAVKMKEERRRQKAETRTLSRSK